jgi:hypothetical protein
MSTNRPSWVVNPDPNSPQARQRQELRHRRTLEKQNQIQIAIGAAQLEQNERMIALQVDAQRTAETAKSQELRQRNCDLYSREFEHLGMSPFDASQAAENEQNQLDRVTRISEIIRGHEAWPDIEESLREIEVARTEIKNSLVRRFAVQTLIPFAIFSIIAIVSEAPLKMGQTIMTSGLVIGVGIFIFSSRPLWTQLKNFQSIANRVTHVEVSELPDLVERLSAEAGYEVITFSEWFNDTRLTALNELKAELQEELDEYDSASPLSLSDANDLLETARNFCDAEN